MLLVTYFLLLSLPLLFLFAKLLKCRNQTTPPFPCPRKLPIIGNLHQLGSQPHISLHKLSLKHGPLMLLRLGSRPTLIISSTNALKEVIKSHDVSFSGRPASYVFKRYSYNFRDIGFSPYSEYWRQARKLCISEVLSMKRVLSFSAIRETELSNLISSIKNTCNSSSVNLSKMLHSLSYRVAIRVTFGDHGLVAADKFGDLLGETQSVLGGFWFTDYLPWLGWIDVLTSMRRRIDRNLRELDEYYNEVIEEHLSDVDGSDHGDLVHVLLQLHRDPVHGKTFSTIDHIKAIMTDMFIAGTDTSPATLTWTMTELIKNPDVMAKAKEEVRKVAVNKSKIEEGDLQHLTYLKLIIKESLRFHPPVPILLPREVIEDCIIQERKIRKNTWVFINFRAISLDPDSWENPERFWPERFIDKDIDFRGNDYGLVPFGAGRRVCPGINFALALVELVLANLLLCFDRELPSSMNIEDLDFEEEIGLTVHKKNHLCLVAKPYVF